MENFARDGDTNCTQTELFYQNFAQLHTHTLLSGERCLGILQQFSLHLLF